MACEDFDMIDLVNRDGFSTFQLSDGRWRASARISDEFGRKRSHSIERKTKDGARKAMKSYLAAYIPHQATPKDTVSAIMRIYLSEFEKKVNAGTKAPSTLRNYKLYQAHVDSKIGHVRAALLTARQVEACMGEQEGGKAKANMRAFLRTVYNRVAIKDGLCVTNPAALASPAEYRPKPKEILTFENFALILAAEPNRLHKAFWLLLSETGDRPVEARRLQSIELTEREDGWWQQLLKSKTEEGKRPIPLSKVCVENLDLAQMYVFANPKTGKPYDETYWRNHWVKAQERAGVSPVVTLYALRHFFGTKMARKVRDDILKRLMRHTDIRVTKQYYVSVLDSELRAAVEPEAGGRN